MRIIDVQGARGGAQTGRAMLSLRQFILEGELAAGQRVMETWVCGRIGISRTPVRAALMRLHEEGFLEAVPGGGYAVRSFSEQDALDAIEVRGAIEGLAARRAAERGVHPRLLQGMRGLIGRMDALIAKPVMSPDDFAAYSCLNEAFHWQIVQVCGGHTVPRLIQRISGMPFAHPSGFVMAQAHQGGAGTMFHLAQDHHRSVLDCLEGGHASRAEALMREHARLAARNLRLALEHRSPALDGDGLQLIRRADAAAH